MSVIVEQIISPQAGCWESDSGNLKVENMEPLLELWLSADSQSISVGRRATLRICAKVGISENECDRLELALGEALANAVVHGSSAASWPLNDSGVQITAWPYSDFMIVQISNTGPRADLPLPPYQMPEPGEGMTHGRGLSLMEALTDAMILCMRDCDKGGASTFLIKRIRKPREGTREFSELG